MYSCGSMCLATVILSHYCSLGSGFTQRWILLQAALEKVEAAVHSVAASARQLRALAELKEAEAALASVAGQASSSGGGLWKVWFLPVARNPFHILKHALFLQ